MRVFGQVQAPDDWRSGLTITGQGEENPTEQVADTSGSQSLGQSAQQVGGGSTGTCPNSATLLGFVLGQRPTCVVPQGKYGAAKLAQYRVNGPAASSNATVSEQFTKIDDPYGVFAALKPNASPLVNGRFDDCYALYTDNPLPDDFVLRVAQNHLINGQIIDQNEITFRPNYVFVCQHARLPASCNFSRRCK